jgi:hypothetical protein
MKPNARGSGLAAALLNARRQSHNFALLERKHVKATTVLQYLTIRTLNRVNTIVLALLSQFESHDIDRDNTGKYQFMSPTCEK